jgi:hypothetical protein
LNKRDKGGKLMVPDFVSPLIIFHSLPMKEKKLRTNVGRGLTAFAPRRR